MVVLDDRDLVEDSLSLFYDPWMIYWERVVFFFNRLREVKS